MDYSSSKQIKIQATSLEGSSRAGKTTLLQKIGKELGGQIGIIPEGSEYIGRDENDVVFDMSTVEGAKESLFFCLEVEKERTKDIMLMAQKGIPIIMDRSLWSILIFYNTLAKVEPAFDRHFEEFYPYVLAVFEAVVKNGSVLMPSKIVYMTVENENVFQSRLGGKSHNKFLGEWKNVLTYERLYPKLVLSHYSVGDILEVHSNNRADDLEKLVTQVSGFISTNRERPIELASILQNPAHSLKYSAADLACDNERYKKIREFALFLIKKQKNHN